MIAVNVDLIGIFISICLLGIRYPHYVILAALVNFFGFCFGAFLLPEGLDSIITSGVFSVAEAPNIKFAEKAVLILSPPFCNYIASKMLDWTEVKRIKTFLNPLAILNNPFSVINLRFAAVSFLYNFSLLF